MMSDLMFPSEYIQIATMDLLKCEVDMCTWQLHFVFSYAQPITQQSIQLKNSTRSATAINLISTENMDDSQ